MSNVSIYTNIKNIIAAKGVLPADFTSEERKATDDKIQWAPGAMEGVLSHHSSGEGGKTAFLETLKRYMTISLQDALDHFESKVADDFKTATEGKIILQYIISNQQAFPPNKLFSLAYYFAANGKRTEAVKLGLALMRLFDLTKNEKDKLYDLLLNLGYCEEFTGYVLDNTYSWSEEIRQKLIFTFAKKLNGWGKINVVEMLKADTEEIKEWILCHGCKNNVMYSYLAMTCALKSDLYDRLLQGGLNDEEFAGATDIISGLIEDGPGKSLVDFEESFGLTIAYFNEAKNHTIDIELIDLLHGIKNYYEFRNLDKAEQVGSMVNELTKDIDMVSLLKENMADNTFRCLRVGNSCDVDLSGELLSLLKVNLKKYFNYSTYLLMKKRYVDEFFALCEERIVECDYPSGMGNSLGMGNLGGNCVSLDMVVQYLDRFPLKGKSMIKICLNSPIVRWRNMAVKALQGWVDELGKKLSDIDGEIYDMIVAVYSKEINPNTKNMLSKLL